MAALAWARSVEGVSDLRRFWHGRASDFTLYEITCFFETLPDNSATVKKASGFEVDVSTLLTALIVDTLRQIGTGLGGKKMKEKDLIVPSLSGEARKKEEADELLKQRFLEKKRAELTN